MDAKVRNIGELIQGAQRILITSHISPDPDAVASVLLLGDTLKFNYPDKKIKMALEEEPTSLSFLGSYDQIEFGLINELTETFTPGLFILLDGNNYDRCSRHNGQQIRDFIAFKSVKSIIIDHHELKGQDEVDFFINRHSAATVQDIYDICFNQLALKMPASAPAIAMTGFYADTGGFIYVKDGQQAEIFGFAEELVSRGANIETIKSQLESYTQSDMKVLGLLALNTKSGPDYTYSYLSDDFINSSNLSPLELQKPSNAFLNNYIRNIDGRRWGFIVYKNVLQGENYYSASFRSRGGEPDVSLIASALGGGGHKPAAGAKFEASSLDEAIKKVQEAIS